MSKIKLTGDSSGYVEISAGDNAGNNTLELPTSGTKVVASDSSNNVNGLGIVTATTFSGALSGTATTATNLADAANITTGTISNDRLPATITKNLTGNVTGNLTGNVTGNLTGNVTGDVTTGVGGSITVGDTIVRPNSIAIGTTDTTGRNAGVGTASGTLIFNSTTSSFEYYNGVSWVSLAGDFVATGGTIDSSTRPGWNIHTFTGSGQSFTVQSGAKNVEYLVVAGGGGGGRWYHAGGGGAGALRYSSSYPVSTGVYPVVAGGGGLAGSPTGRIGGQGSDSNFGPIISDGGGGGNNFANSNESGAISQLNGGSGGGGMTQGSVPQDARSGGTATGSPGGSNGSNSPSSGWGNPGGYGEHGPLINGGGGGGAGAAGNPAATNNYAVGFSGKGGDGLQYSISGSATYYAGGGGGSNYNGPPTSYGPGGLGGGGRGGGASQSTTAGRTGEDGDTNRGSGGGGGERPDGNGGAGGSGIVIIAYPTT